MNYWLLKTEPSTYSWHDLKNEKNRTTSWEGVRNYQARNYIRDGIRAGDLAFIYHSVQKPQAIIGIAEIVREAYPDHFAFEMHHRYFDPKSRKDNPVWLMVDVRAIREFTEPVTMEQLKMIPELMDMVLLNNTRLSVQPVTKKEWELIISLNNLNNLD